MLAYRPVLARHTGRVFSGPVLRNITQSYGDVVQYHFCYGLKETRPYVTASLSLTDRFHFIAMEGCYLSDPRVIRKAPNESALNAKLRPCENDNPIERRPDLSHT